jgi:hypothetical protein
MSCHCCHVCEQPYYEDDLRRNCDECGQLCHGHCYRQRHINGPWNCRDCLKKNTCKWCNTTIIDLIGCSPIDIHCCMECHKKTESWKVQEFTNSFTSTSAWIRGLGTKQSYLDKIEALGKRLKDIDVPDISIIKCIYYYIS